MTAISIRNALPRDIPQIRTVVAGALADDPLLRWLIPPELPTRLSRLAVFYSAQVERLVLVGHAEVAVDGEDVIGAALWSSPDTPRLETLPYAAELAGIVGDPARAQRFTEQFQSAREGLTSCSGPYLATLGVLGSHRGRGVGRRLLDDGHAHFGAAATWLESTNPRNQTLYERAGYSVTHRAPIADDTTTMSQMIREAG